MESTSPSLLVRTSLQLSFSAPARVRLRSTASRRWVGAGRGRGHLQRKVAAKFVPRAKQTWLPPRWVWSEEGRKQKGDGDTQGRRTYTLHTSCLLSRSVLLSVAQVTGDMTWNSHCTVIKVIPIFKSWNKHFSQRREKSLF